MNEISIQKTKIADIDEVVSIETTKENRQFILPNTKKEHFDLLGDTNIEHLIIKSEKNQTIGFVILGGLADKNRSIEFRRIVIKEKGKGYGRKVIQEVKCYCFEKLKCHRLWLDVLESNQRARHLYQSEGFKEEGKLRECLFTDDNYKSLVIMSILENEYLHDNQHR